MATLTLMSLQQLVLWSILFKNVVREDFAVVHVQGARDERMSVISVSSLRLLPVWAVPPSRVYAE